MKRTFAIDELVRVEIKAPWKPNGMGTISRFLKWCMDEEIISERGGGSGPGYYVGFFQKRHAKRIRAWLEDDGVKARSSS